MKLSELLKNVEVLNSLGDADVDITGVNIDSRRIEKGHLFPQHTCAWYYLYCRRIYGRCRGQGCHRILW